MVETAFMAAGAAANIGAGYAMDAIQGDTGYPPGGGIEGLTNSDTGKSGVDSAVQIDPEIAIKYFEKAAAAFESSAEKGLQYYQQAVSQAQVKSAQGYIAGNAMLEPIATQGSSATAMFMRSLGLNALSPTRFYSQTVDGLGETFNAAAREIYAAEKIQDPTQRAAAKAQINTLLNQGLAQQTDIYKKQQEAAIKALGPAPSYQDSAQWAFQAQVQGLTSKGSEGNNNQRYVDALMGTGAWQLAATQLNTLKAQDEAKGTDGFLSTATKGQGHAGQGGGYNPSILQMATAGINNGSIPMPQPKNLPDFHTWLAQQGAVESPNAVNVYNTTWLAMLDYENQMAQYNQKVAAVQQEYAGKISNLTKKTKDITKQYDMNYLENPEYFKYSKEENLANIENFAPFLEDFKKTIGTAQAWTTDAYDKLEGQMIKTRDPTVESLENTPGYQFMYQQGNKAALAAAAKGGMLGSGNTMAAVDQYSQGLAQQVYQNEYQNFLQGTQINNANLAARGVLGTQYANQGGALASAYGNAQNNYLASLQNLMGAGNQATGQMSANTIDAGNKQAQLLTMAGQAALDTYNNIGQAQYQSLTHSGDVQNTDNLANMQAQNDAIARASNQRAAAAQGNQQASIQAGYLNLQGQQQQVQHNNQSQAANAFYSNYNV